MLLVNQTLRLLEQAAEMRPFRLGSRTAEGAKGHIVTKKDTKAELHLDAEFRDFCG